MTLTQTDYAMFCLIFEHENFSFRCSETPNVVQPQGTAESEQHIRGMPIRCRKSLGSEYFMKLNKSKTKVTVCDGGGD